jgi:hypothetical protein
MGSRSHGFAIFDQNFDRGYNAIDTRMG